MARRTMGTRLAAWRHHGRRPASMADSTPMNVLVVDDNADTAEMYAALLGLRGHVVAKAHDSLTALACLRDFHPDVAVLDLGLPDLHGYELAEHLRVNGSDCGIVVVTGTPERDAQRCAKLRVSRYLHKPVDLDVLVEAVEHAAVAPSA